MSNRALRRAQAQKAKEPQQVEDEDDFEDAPPKKSFSNAFDMVVYFVKVLTSAACRGR